MDEKMTPKIRFKGFQDDWERRKFFDIVTRLNKTSNSYELPKLEFEDIISGEGRLNKNIKNKKDNRKGIIFFPENILYGKLRPYLKNWLFANFTGIALGDFWVLEAKEIVPEFLYTLIQSNDYQKVANDTSGTKMPRSDWKKVSSTLFLIPSKNKEQGKIGSLFQTLDALIASNQKKLDNLQTLKKLLMQKIFNQDWRFKGFTDPWEQRKLGGIFTERSERNSEGELISVTINYGVIRAAEIDRKDNSSQDKSNYKVVKKGDIAYNSMRMWQGASGYSPYTGILSPAYTVIEPKRNQNSKFYAFMFKLDNLIQVFQKNSQGLTSDTWNLKFPTFSKIKVIVPRKEEQDRIECILEQIDSLIASNQQHLDQLQTLKKYLMQNMFV